MRNGTARKPVDDNKTQREQRLAAALRANLQRRKLQARQRARGESDAPDEREEADSDMPDADRPGGKG
jgi:hypothetical protein